MGLKPVTSRCEVALFSANIVNSIAEFQLATEITSAYSTNPSVPQLAAEVEEFCPAPRNHFVSHLVFLLRRRLGEGATERRALP